MNTLAVKQHIMARRIYTQIFLFTVWWSGFSLLLYLIGQDSFSGQAAA